MMLAVHQAWGWQRPTLEATALLSRLEVALVLRRVRCRGRRQGLLDSRGLRVLQTDARHFPELRSRELLLDCLQVRVLSLLQDDEELLSTGSHSLFRVLRVIDKHFGPWILMSCHFEG
jgi:hypothetical protein